MKRALFVIILMCLAVSAVTAQGPAKVAPKHYKVAEVPWPASVSSDGRYLAYVDDADGDDHVFVRDVKTGESRRLTEGPGEAGDFSIISPNGAHVAYDWLLGGSAAALWELRVMRVDGSGQRVVYQENGLLLLHPRGWSPDGKHILADLLRKDGSYQFVLVSVGDGSVRVLKELALKTPSRYERNIQSTDLRRWQHNQPVHQIGAGPTLSRVARAGGSSRSLPTSTTK